MSKLDVLHVGDMDPWKSYAPVRMGQWPALLSLPKFAHLPTAPDAHAFLPSQEFVRTVEDQWRELASMHRFFALRGHVNMIREAQHGFDVECVCGDTIRTIKAAYVDICGGPGPSQRLCSSLISDAALRQEYEDGIGRALPWPRLLTGEMFLRGSTTVVPEGGNVAVFGGGSTAAWCVERAQSRKCSILWAAKSALNAAFLPSERNDELAQGPLTRSRSNGIQFVAGELYPTDCKTRFAEGVDVEKIFVEKDNLISLTLCKNDKVVENISTSPGRHVDSSRRPLPFPPPPERFHQVVVALGHKKELRQKGSWAHFVEPLLKAGRPSRSHLLLDRHSRVVGLKSSNGRLRVLGSAALCHPEVAREWRRTSGVSYKFFQTMVEQAKVSIGITLSAVTVAEANGLWSLSANPNINTASRADFAAVWSKFSHAADSWYFMRAARTHPLTEVELEFVFNSMKDHY